MANARALLNEFSTKTGHAVDTQWGDHAGPSHMPTFTCTVRVGSLVSRTAKGGAKKTTMQRACSLVVASLKKHGYLNADGSIGQVPPRGPPRSQNAERPAGLAALAAQRRVDPYQRPRHHLGAGLTAPGAEARATGGARAYPIDPNSKLYAGLYDDNHDHGHSDHAASSNNSDHDNDDGHVELNHDDKDDDHQHHHHHHRHHLDDEDDDDDGDGDFPAMDDLMEAVPDPPAAAHGHVVPREDEDIMPSQALGRQPKSLVMEYCQALMYAPPEVMEEQSGPPHSRRFTVTCRVQWFRDPILFRSYGTRKKDAESDAMAQIVTYLILYGFMCPITGKPLTAGSTGDDGYATRQQQSPVEAVPADADSHVEPQRPARMPSDAVGRMPKSLVMEYCQATGRAPPTSSTVGSGPPHMRTFTTTCRVNWFDQPLLFQGTDKRKKDAEHRAMEQIVTYMLEYGLMHEVTGRPVLGYR